MRRSIEEHFLGVAHNSLVEVSDEEKLRTLRRLDQFRQWRSLDEKRYCLVCGEIIDGREINVIGPTHANGPLRVTCPTEHCNAVPMEWVQPTDDVLIRMAMVEFERRWLGLIIRAGRATQALHKKTRHNRIRRTEPKPRLD